MSNYQSNPTNKTQLKALKPRGRHYGRGAKRVVRYGVKSFRRNDWLSVAAIIVMTITLVVISATLLTTHVMSSAMDVVKQQVDMSVYLKRDTSQKEVDKISHDIAKLDSVEGVKVIKPSEASHLTTKKIIDENQITDKELIKALKEVPNVIPWTLNIKIKDLNQPTELEHFVYTDPLTKKRLDTKPPSFSSRHRETINRIGQVMSGVRIGGLVATAIFALISIIIIYNTIRMAIFNRKEEIYMMKLVGAGRAFIRGPFLVEAAVYGVIATFFAAIIISLLVFGLNGHIPLPMTATVAAFSQYYFVLIFALLCCGVLIAVISALFATWRYLKSE